MTPWRGNLYIQGQATKLVLERLWLTLRRLQGMGIIMWAISCWTSRAFQLPTA